VCKDSQWHAHGLARAFLVDEKIPIELPTDSVAETKCAEHQVSYMQESRSL